MSTIYNLDLLTDRYKDNNFKEREVKAFEIKFPEARIIMDKYDNERELEDDWQKYCGLPYHLKVLSNERCLRLYGVKNEQQYMKLKSDFIKKDISNSKLIDSKYTPMGFTEAVEDEILIKQARDYMNGGGRSILLLNYDNLADLNTDWYNYNNQCYDHKVIANNKSLEIYGKTVPEVYQNEVKKFLMRDINNSSLDDLSLHHIVTDSLSATEAVLDTISTTLDPVESIMLLEMAINQISSPVEQSLIEMVGVTLKNQIQERMVFKENYLGLYNYLLPWEVMNLFENVDTLCEEEMFKNYYARGIGLKSPMTNFHNAVSRMLLLEENKDNLLKIGWNFVLDPTDLNSRTIAARRANETLREYCKYWFLNLENTPDLLTEEESNQEFHKGISIIIIQELDKMNAENVVDLPKVLVSLDYRESNWYPIIYGEISTMSQDVDNLISQFKIPIVSCYFLHLSDDLYERIKNINIKEFNTYNEIKKICSLLQLGCPDIANKKLYITYLLSSIMHSKYGHEVFPLRYDHDCPKEIVVTLYSKLFGKYHEIKDSYSKLQLFNEDGVNLQETFILQDSKLIADDIEENQIYRDLVDLSTKPKFTETWQDFQELFNIKPNI